MADSKTAMAALQTALDASERDLSRSQTDLLQPQTENARLTELNAQLTRENTDFGKRPVAGPALTHADVLAMIAADAAASPRNETRGEPMDTEGDPRGSTSGDLSQGIGNGRTVGQKHALPQAVRQDDPAPPEPISARKLALMKARKALAKPSYAMAAKTEGLISTTRRIILSPPSPMLTQQVIDDLRDHLTRLFKVNKIRRKANWMTEMPASIKDAALKGPKRAPHYPAAPSNDDRLDEKLPRSADRQLPSENTRWAPYKDSMQEHPDSPDLSPSH
eukprot:gene4913-biopygen15220